MSSQYETRSVTTVVQSIQDTQPMEAHDDVSEDEEDFEEVLTDSMSEEDFDDNEDSKSAVYHPSEVRTVSFYT